MIRNVRLFVVVAIVSFAGWARAEIMSSSRSLVEDGLSLLNAGDLTHAESALRQACEDDPGNLRAWDVLSWTLWREGRAAEAIKIWNNVALVDPSNPARYRTLGEAELGAERPMDAIVHLTESLRLEPDQPRVRFRLAEAYEGAEDWAHALSLYEQAQPKPGDDLWLTALLRRCRMLEQLGRMDEACDLVTTAAREHRTPELIAAAARYQARMGDDASREGDFAKAIRCYSAALRWSPGNPRFMLNLAWARHNGRKDDDTESDPRDTPSRMEAPSLNVDMASTLARIIEPLQLPDDAPGARPAAPTTEDLGDEASLLALGRQLAGTPAAGDKAQDLSPVAEARARQVARALLEKGHMSLGLSVLVRHMRRESIPSGQEAVRAQLLADLGNLAYQCEQLDEAVGFYELALRLLPAQKRALRDLGWTQWKREDWSACQSTWKRYASTFPELGEPHALLARLALQRMDYTNAVIEARLAVRKGNPLASSRLLLVNALLGAGQFREAGLESDSLAADYPANVRAQRMRGAVLTKRGDHVGARDQWRRVLDLDPGSKMALFNWIKAMYECGQCDQAISEATRAARESNAPVRILELLAADALARHDIDEAARWYARLAHEQPQNVRYWLELSRCENKLKRSISRMSHLKEGLRHLPGSVPLRLEVADTLASDGWIRRALRAYDEILKDCPACTAAYIGRLDMLEAARPAEALESLARNTEWFLSEQQKTLREARLLWRNWRRADAIKVLDTLSSPKDGRHYVPILVYHGLSSNARSISMPASVFDDQMAALKSAGYETIFMTDLTQILDGKLPFPAKPILVTFDDARVDSFEIADAVLARHALKATMFVPTGRIRDENYFHASWAPLRHFAGTGRWDLESHGHEAHDDIPINAEGETGPFLACRQWLGDKKRIETLDEFQARISEDYRLSRDVLREGAGVAPAVAFAAPFSDFGQMGNDDAPIIAANEKICRAYFRFCMIQDESGYNILRQGPSQPFILRRLAAHPEWSGAQLLAELARRSPHNAAAMQLAQFKAGDGLTREAGALLDLAVKSEPLLRAQADSQRAQIAAARQRPREAAELLGTNAALDDTTASLRERVAWDNRPRIGAGVEGRRDSADRTSQRSFARLDYPLPAAVNASVEAGELKFTHKSDSISGTEIKLASAAPVGVNNDASAWLRFRQLKDADERVNGGMTGLHTVDRHSWRLEASREDVDTLLARQAGIDFDQLRLSYDYRYPEFRVSTRVGYRRMSDHNTREDVGASLSVPLAGYRGVEYGAGLYYSTSDERSDLYYAPRNVMEAEWLLAWRHEWQDGSLLQFNGAAGLAVDATNDARPSGNARLSYVWRMTRRWRLLLNGDFSALPDYTSQEASLEAQFGF